MPDTQEAPTGEAAERVKRFQAVQLDLSHMKTDVDAYTKQLNNFETILNTYKVLGYISPENATDLRINAFGEVRDILAELNNHSYHLAARYLTLLRVPRIDWNDTANESCRFLKEHQALSSRFWKTVGGLNTRITVISDRIRVPGAPVRENTTTDRY